MGRGESSSQARAEGLLNGPRLLPPTREQRAPTLSDPAMLISFNQYALRAPEPDHAPISLKHDVTVKRYLPLVSRELSREDYQVPETLFVALALPVEQEYGAAFVTGHVRLDGIIDFDPWLHKQLEGAMEKFNYRVTRRGRRGWKLEGPPIKRPRREASIALAEAHAALEQD